MIRAILYTSINLFLLVHSGFGQNLDFEFIKNCLNYNETDLQSVLSAKNFRLIEKDHKNMGDKLINKSDYYSNKIVENQIENAAETAVFVHSKRGKKSAFISFTQNHSFSNFNGLEADVRKNFKKESVFQTDQFESSIVKYSDKVNFYYLFKEEETYYLIVSNYQLEEIYFHVK